MKRNQAYIGRKLAGGLAAATLLAGCAPDGAQQEVEFRVPVAVEEVGVATLEDRIVTTGTLRAAEIVQLASQRARPIRSSWRPALSMKASRSSAISSLSLPTAAAKEAFRAPGSYAMGVN